MGQKIRRSPLLPLCGVALSVLLCLGSLVSLQEVVQLGQERLAVHAVNHAGFLNGLTTGRGAAQAVHTDGKEQGSGLRSDVQNVTNDGAFFGGTL